MEILSKQLSDYLENLVPPRHPELKKMEDYAAKNNFPIIGPICGHLCYQMARTIGAKRIFELGSGYGYSTAWFAQAVKENGGGEVHHVVWDDDLSKMAREHLKTLGYEGMVKYTVGEAIQTLQHSHGPFDLIFNDIDKADYPKSLPLIYDKLRVGGVLIIDNILWSGRIFADQDQSDATKAIRETTGMVMNNDRWVASVVPMRDGLLVATKLR